MLRFKVKSIVNYFCIHTTPDSLFYSVQPFYYYVKLYNILYVQIKKDIWTENECLNLPYQLSHFTWTCQQHEKRGLGMFEGL